MDVCLTRRLLLSLDSAGPRTVWVHLSAQSKNTPRLYDGPTSLKRDIRILPSFYYCQGKHLAPLTANCHLPFRIHYSRCVLSRQPTSLTVNTLSITRFLAVEAVIPQSSFDPVYRKLLVAFSRLFTIGSWLAMPVTNILDWRLLGSKVPREKLQGTSNWESLTRKAQIHISLVTFHSP